MNTLFRRFSRLVAARPVPVLAAALALTLLLGLGLPRLRVDADMTDDIPSTVPEKAFYDEVGAIFPSDDFLIVALSDSAGAFSPGMLRQIREWTEAFAGLDGVKKAISPSSAGLIRGTEAGIVIEEAMPELPETPEAIAAYRARVEGNELVRSLLGKDGKSAAILVTLKDGVDQEPLPRVLVRLPAGAVPDEGFIAELGALTVTESEGGAALPAVRRIYLPGSELDRREALAGFGARLEPDRRGRASLLVALDRDRPFERAAEAVTALAKQRGWKARATAAPVTGYDRAQGLIAGLPTYTDGPVYVSGSKAVSSIVGKLLITDLALLFPVVILIIVLVLFLSFRTLRGVLLPLGNVVLSVLWAMGLMGLLGQPISMATMILPIILIAVGTAYTIHVINRFYEDLVTIEDQREAIASTVAHVALPVFLAGATTVIGFGSLAISGIPALRMFGILSALGILFALILSLSLTPALLALLPRPQARTVAAHDDSRLAGALAGLGRLVARRPRTVLAACLALVLGIGAFAPRVSFETNTLNSFKAGSEIRRASEYLNENFTGITVMTVVVRTEEEGAILEPAVLGAMDRLQARLESLRLLEGQRVVAPGEEGYEEARPLVGGTQSIVTFVKGVNKALHADDPVFDAVPPETVPAAVGTERYSYRNGSLEERDSETGELLAVYPRDGELRVEKGFGYLELGGVPRKVDLATGLATDLVPGRIYAGQLVFQYENSGGPEAVEGFLDNPRRSARINVFIKSASSSVMGQIQARAREAIAADFPAEARADITGLSNLTLAILRLLVQSQIGSVLSSLVICLLFIALMSRNLVEGVVSIVPLSCSLIINFGTMALLGIPIDISTATIASIGIGIGIDYTCHFLERLKLTLRALPLEQAIEETLRTTGKGIFVNALAVAGGFSALLLSQLRGNISMGFLMALIMLTSSLFAVTLLPALLVLLRPRFLNGRGGGAGSGAAGAAGA